MAFHFSLMSHLLLALVRGDASPIVETVMAADRLPDACQWATLLRNHDELALSCLTERDGEWLLEVCAPDPRMRLHGGIRRRLAPLLGKDRRRIELAFALLLALPGSPIVYYGDEIGMGDDIRLPDRDGVRTPMQWTGDRNAGFSDSRTEQPVIPVIADSTYGYRGVNVTAQSSDPQSLLMRVTRLLHVRRRHPALSRGAIEFLPTGHPSVLAFVRRWENDVIVVAANLSASSVSIALELPDAFIGAALVELVDDIALPSRGPHPCQLSLGPYASYWFQYIRADAAAVYETAAADSTAVPEIGIRRGTR